MYQYRSDGAIRNFTNRHLVAENRGLVGLRTLTGGRVKFVKSVLLAVVAHGWPAHWTCKCCLERVYDKPQRLDKQGPICPENLKWVPDGDAMLYHEMRECLQSLMRCKRHEEFPGRPQVKLKEIDEDPYGDDDLMMHITTPRTEKFIEYNLKK